MGFVLRAGANCSKRRVTDWSPNCIPEGWLLGIDLRVTEQQTARCIPRRTLGCGVGGVLQCWRTPFREDNVLGSSRCYVVFHLLGPSFDRSPDTSCPRASISSISDEPSMIESLNLYQCTLAVRPYKFPRALQEWEPPATSKSSGTGKRGSGMLLGVASILSYPIASATKFKLKLE